MSKTTFTILIIIILAALVGGGYWFYMRSLGNGSQGNGITDSSGNDGGIFSPFGKNNGRNATSTNNNTNNGTSTPNRNFTPESIPTLRQLSTTPVGGVAASSTASSSIVRWIDRGVGRVYQATSDSLAVTELSNTTVPMIDQSFWNRNINAFIFQSATDDASPVINYYTELKPIQVSASSSLTSSLASSTPYELQGEPLAAGTVAIAVSPKGDRVFTLVKNAGSNSVGYVSQFNGTKRAQIFDTPLTQLNVEWPEENTIALTTKPTFYGTGFLYLINPKGSAFNKILGNIAGLDTLVNKNTTKVLYSASIDSSIKTSIYTIKTAKSQDLAFNTLPEKCIWSTLNRDTLYCAVPSTIPAGNYPDAWYQGSVTWSDSIWQVDTSTGEVHKLADLLSLSKGSIDAENLTLDPKENFIYFINKKDLTLWSLGLTQ